MKNPWTKRNPFMSLWLSGANSIAGTARGRVTAEGRRQATAMMNEGAKQAIIFWSNLFAPQPTSTRRHKPRSRR
jgi:hypothetical protein